MNVHDVWVFPETVRHRKTGEMLVAVFAVRDDVRVIAAQVGRTKADALDGFKERVHKRCQTIIRNDGDRGAMYMIHYTEEPRQIRALQLLLKSLASSWDFIRQGVLDAYDQTHRNAFFAEVDRAAEERRRAAELERGD